MRERYQENAEEIKSYQRTYRSEHREEITKKRRPYQRRFYLQGRIVPKVALLLAAGGKCSRCGCDNLAALHFHHRDPSTKRFSVATAITQNSRKTHSWKEIYEEAKKCDVVCANCHAIEHSTWLPEELEWITEMAMKQLVQAHVMKMVEDE